MKKSFALTALSASAVCFGLLVFPSLSGCSDGAANPTQTTTPTVAPSLSPSPSASPTSAPIKSYTYKVINSYPHDRTAFTEGLLVKDGVFYESTGLNGKSTLRQVEIETGKVLKKIDVPSQYFGEGIQEFGGKVYQLTWQTNIGFIYDKDTFNKVGQFAYTGEGWGMTTDGTYLIMSDGTPRIRFMNPADFKEVKSINVTDNGQPLKDINELEYIKGEIYANVWQTNEIVRINPADGKVTGHIDMTNILSPADAAGVDVLNGIAYDKDKDRIFVTGKNWPKMFEVKFVEQ